MTRAGWNEPAVENEIGNILYREDQLERRVITAAGGAAYQVIVFDPGEPVVEGDGLAKFHIPPWLAGATLIGVTASLGDPGTTDTQIQIRHCEECEEPGTDVLTTKCTILAGDCYSGDSAVVDDGVTVAAGDELQIDLDLVGTDAAGLDIAFAFADAELASFVIQGSPGRPGGIVNFLGPWVITTVYEEGDAVTHNGSTYVAIQDHTADADNEPGVGADWEDFWVLLVGGPMLGSAAIEFAVTGNGYVIDTGIKGTLRVPYACTIVEATLLADSAGNLVVDIWKDTYTNYPPTDADSITASAPPTLTGAVKSTDTSLSGWTTALAAGDTLVFNVDSCSVIKRFTLALMVERL